MNNFFIRIHNVIKAKKISSFSLNITHISCKKTLGNIFSLSNELRYSALYMVLVRSISYFLSLIRANHKDIEALSEAGMYINKESIYCI